MSQSAVFSRRTVGWLSVRGKPATYKSIGEILKSFKYLLMKWWVMRGGPRLLPTSFHQTKETEKLSLRLLTLTSRLPLRHRPVSLTLVVIAFVLCFMDVTSEQREPRHHAVTPSVLPAPTWWMDSFIVFLQIASLSDRRCYSRNLHQGPCK